MSIPTQETINAIMKHWEKLRDEGDPFTKWEKKTLEEKDSCLFFLKIILNQRQKSGIAGKAADAFVTKFYESDEKTFWENISLMSESELLAKCRFEKETTYGKESRQKIIRAGVSYAGINANKFPSWIKKAASIILKVYHGKVGNIWKDITKPSQEQVDELQKRFKQFPGIGEELSRMAVFQLVRGYGIAGGWDARRFLKTKRDTHLLKVIRNVFFAGDPQMDKKGLKAFVDGLDLDSPADFDHAAFDIGKKFCSEQDRCPDCPIRNACAYGKKKARP